MSVEQASSGATPVSEEAVRAELERVVGSASFAQAARATRLLRFLVDETLAGRAGELKEYVLGVEVFDKGEGFDPRADSSVRVEVARLRTRLEGYYLNTGQDDPVILKIPKGAYTVVFESRPSLPPVRTRWWRWAVGASLVIAGVAAGAFWLVPRASGPPELSVAVLPFTALSGTERAGYEADGFTEELTAVLGNEPKLKVAARTSAMRFKGKNEDVRGIAGQLHVAKLVEGSIQELPNARLRVTVQLIDGRSGYHVWSRIYDRERAGVRGVLDEVSAGLHEALRIPPPAARQRTALPEVEALYFQAVYLRNQKDPAARQRGMDALEKAAALDERFAPAQASLAMIYGGRYFAGDADARHWAQRSMNAARLAIEGDGRNAKAHTALGWLLWFHDRDWLGAEAALRKALAINPSLAAAHNIYGLMLATRGRFDEARAEVGLAKSLDPMNYLVSTDAALVAYCAGRFDETERIAKDALKVNPEFLYGHELIGVSLSGRGRHQEALPELRRVAAATGHAEAIARYGFALAKAGDQASARAELAKIGTEPRFGFARALIYNGLGDQQRMMEALRLAATERASSVVFAAVDPAFRDWRGQAPFDQLLTQLGLR